MFKGWVHDGIVVGSVFNRINLHGYSNCYIFQKIAFSSFSQRGSSDLPSVLPVGQAFIFHHHQRPNLSTLPLGQLDPKRRLFPNGIRLLVPFLRPVLGRGLKFHVVVPDDSSEDGTHFDVGETRIERQGLATPARAKRVCQGF